MASLAALARRQPRAAARNAPSLGAQPGASKPEQGGTAGAAGVARTAAEVLKQMEISAKEPIFASHGFVSTS